VTIYTIISLVLTDLANPAIWFYVGLALCVDAIVLAIWSSRRARSLRRHKWEWGDPSPSPHRRPKRPTVAPSPPMRACHVCGRPPMLIDGEYQDCRH